MTQTRESQVLLQCDRLDLEGAISKSAELKVLPDSDLYLFDFGPLSWVEPFGMLLFASELRAFRSRHSAARFRALNYEHCGYAAHMGFFQSFGLTFGNDPGEAPGGLRYVPITSLSISTVESEAAALYEDVRVALEGRCAKLANVLTQGGAGDLSDTLTYSLREIFRNVLEHSRANEIWYSAQYWPQRKHVELAILDEGIGIRTSLSKNPHLTISNDEDALILALLPGVSGVAFKGGPRQRDDDVWANSGYGLFMTSQLCSQSGSFFVCSGQAGLQIERGTVTPKAMSVKGTALSMSISVPDVMNLGQQLKQLHVRGMQLAKEAKSRPITASLSSRMLFGRKDESRD